MWRAFRPRRPDPVVFVIAALLCASTLVIFLHHRALAALDRQTTVILQKISEQTAAAAAQRIRATFDGPVFDTLASVNHPFLVAGRFDLVAAAYRKGLATYPQVDRFFIWTDAADRNAPGEALFYGPAIPVAAPGGGDPKGGLSRDPVLGRAVLAAARRYAVARQIYAAVPAEANGERYDVFIRLYYTDAARDRFFAVLGFVVNLNHVRTHLFPDLHRRFLASLLEPKDASPRFDMRIIDDENRLAYGPAEPIPAISARSPFALQFYPVDDIRTRMAAMVPHRQWTIVISPRSETAGGMFGSTGAQGYWLSGLSVLLMFVALVFAIQTSQRAAQLARMQSEFVAHVSHQLKTPVSLLSAVAETVSLERVRSPEKLAKCIGIIRGETARLSALIERILDFSRVADTRRRFELEAVELEPLARDTVEAFVEALDTRGYRIAVVNIGGSPVVAADRAALEQALLNLLDNAIKYSGLAGEIAVRVGIAGGEAIIDVADQGPGIAPKDQARIFDRFYRGAAAAAHRQGFGLGLPIVREIVTAHRGRIDVASTPGAGSTFRIRLPLLQDAVQAPAGWLRTRVGWRKEAS